MTNLELLGRTSNFTAMDYFGCGYYPTQYLETEFYLVTVLGTTLAAISIINNSILLYLFMTRPYFRRSVFFYITVLSVLDVLHGIFYIMTMSLAILFQYTENLTLQVIWHSYFIPVHTLSHIVLVVGAYMLVAASFERFLAANWFSGICQKRGRLFTLLSLLIFAVICKGTVYFEYRVIYRPACNGLAKYIIFPTELKLDNRLYREIWTFWLRNFIAVFIPILLLIVLNTGIVLQNYFTCVRVDIGTGRHRLRLRTPRKIKKPKKELTASTKNIANCGSSWNGVVVTVQSEADGVSATPRTSLTPTTGKNVGLKTCGWVSKARARVRKAATRTLIAIVIEYVICNSLSVVLTAWEQIDQEDLTNRLQFYTYASDTVNLLTVISCAIRLPTYCLCDVTLRTELYRMLMQCYRRTNSQSPLARRGAEGDISNARNQLLKQRFIDSIHSRDSSINYVTL